MADRPSQADRRALCKEFIELRVYRALVRVQCLSRQTLRLNPCFFEEALKQVSI